MAALSWDSRKTRMLEIGDELTNFARHFYSILILVIQMSSEVPAHTTDPESLGFGTGDFRGATTAPREQTCCRTAAARTQQ